MLALVNTPGGNAPVDLREVAEPQPALNEALVEVRAFSLNRGELRLFQVRPEGWRPGQDISGVVLRQAADGSGPAAGARVVALTDNAGWAERAAVPTHRMAAFRIQRRAEPHSRIDDPGQRARLGPAGRPRGARPDALSAAGRDNPLPADHTVPRSQAGRTAFSREHATRPPAVPLLARRADRSAAGQHSGRHR
jgi:hypothetical protein